MSRVYKTSGGRSSEANDNIVGGMTIGEVGTGFYDGYTLSWGDDFNDLDILAPHLPNGRWFTTRTYLAGSRGSDTLLGTMYDTDPYHTGHNDTNKGVPVGYDNMHVEGSAVTMQARKSTAGEQTYMSTARNELGCMLSGAGAISWYPSTSGINDIIYEARISFSAAAGNPAGWHPTMWLQSLNPVIALDSDEWDWEANSQAAFMHRSVWTAGAASVNTYGAGRTHDGKYYVISFILNSTDVKLYVDGVLYATGTANANTKSKPQYPLITNHIYNGTFETEAYSAAAWNADGDGATLSVDYVRVWRRTANSHYAPLTAVGNVNVDYGSSVDIVIPSALTLWGDAGVTEYLQAVYNEENEPSVTHSTVFTQFPTGVTYNSGSRTLTVNITSGKTGRINFVMSAWKVGTTCEPLRFAVNVGPRLAITALEYTEGSSSSYDLYAQCDCGVLTSNGVSRNKTISVTGLTGSGMSYDDSTGLITGTAILGSYPLNVTITNSLGQTSTTAITFTVSVAGSGITPPTLTGSPLLEAYFDFTDNTKITQSGGSIDSIVSSGNSTITLTNTGTNRPTLTTLSGYQVADFASANSQFLQASGLSLPQGGSLVVVASVKTNAASQCLVDKGLGTATTTTSREDILAVFNGGYRFRKGGSATNSDATLTPGVNFTTGIHLLVGKTASGTTAPFIWGDGKTTFATGTSIAQGSVQDTFSIGARRASSTNDLFADARIACVLYYSGILDAVNAEEVAVWANTHFGTSNLA